MTTASRSPWSAVRTEARSVRTLKRGVSTPATSMIATSCRRWILARAVPTSRSALADAAGPVAHALRVRHRREHDAPVLAHALLVGAAAPADDARGAAADQRRRVLLQAQERGLHRPAECVVAPRPVAADHAVTRDDERHGIGAERVADRTRGPRMAERAREVGGPRRGSGRHGGSL